MSNAADTQLWINPEFVVWPTRWSSGTTRYSDKWRRAYEMQAHADARLADDGSSFAATDAIAALKRAIDQRLRKLDECYRFRSIPIQEKPKDHLDLLEYFGLIRPTLLRNLRSIRNSIEHEDAPPPSIDMCREFSDFVWFFLRATDRFVQSIPTSFCFAPDHSEPSITYFVEFKLNPPVSWSPEFLGWFPREHVSSVPKEKWANVIVQRMETWFEFLQRTEDQKDSISAFSRLNPRNPDDVCIAGTMRGPSESLRAVYRAYFDDE